MTQATAFFTQFTLPQLQIMSFFSRFYFPTPFFKGWSHRQQKRRDDNDNTNARIFTKMTLTSPPPPPWKDLYDGAFLTTRIFIHSWGFLMMTITPRFILSHLVFIYFLLFFFFPVLRL